MTEFSLRGVQAESEQPPDWLVEECRDWAEGVLEERDAGDAVAAAIASANRQLSGERESRSRPSKVRVQFKASEVPEDGEDDFTGRLVEETEDELVLERDVPFLNIFGSGAPFQSKTLQTTVRKDALRTWTKP